MKQWGRAAALLLIAAALFSCTRSPGGSVPATGYDPQLEVRSQSGTWTLPLSRLRQEVAVQKVTVHDAMHAREKTYEGFLLQDLAAHSHNLGAETVIFHCRDGFSLRMPVATARRAGMVLAFHDMDQAEGFGSSKDNPVYVGLRDRAASYVRDHGREFEQLKTVPPARLTAEQRKALQAYEAAVAERDRWARRVDELNGLGTVGPFQPVLTRRGAVPELAGWEAPDAVRAIEFEHVAFGGRDYPTGARSDSSVMKGYQLFHSKCLSCHSMNGDGGKSAPELNVPVNVTEYWNEKYLVPMIVNARSVRARSMMSVQPDIKEPQARLIVEYLRYMKDHKVE